MSDVEIVKVDQGGVNARILAREAPVDFRRVEAPSLKLSTRFHSAEGKRMFVRHFHNMQLAIHFISVIARTRLDPVSIEQVEAKLRADLEAAGVRLDQAIDEAEAQFKDHGITGIASYDTVPLEVDVQVLSSISRCYLELLGKLDQVMPLLQTLEIHEVISAQAVDIRRAELKRLVRDVANGSRSLAAGLRRRLNAMGARPARGADDAPGESGDIEGQAVIGDEAEVEAEALPDPLAALPASFEDGVEVADTPGGGPGAVVESPG